MNPLDSIASIYHLKRLPGEADENLEARIVKENNLWWKAIMRETIKSGPELQISHLMRNASCDCGAAKANTTHSHWCSTCK